MFCFTHEELQKYIKLGKILQSLLVMHLWQHKGLKVLCMLRKGGEWVKRRANYSGFFGKLIMLTLFLACIYLKIEII